jgi:hypothetical protein
MNRRLVLLLASCALILTVVWTPQPVVAGGHCIQSGVCNRGEECCSGVCYQPSPAFPTKVCLEGGGEV